ncbi:hypothetical protein M0805_004895 [Coniferiporia weirii]|nr:hypothetical protein M0805_004895 [Coniferiporia weirii]
MSPSKTDIFDDEKSSATPIVVPLRKEHLDNAYESYNAAFKDDPVFAYINEGAKKPGPRLQAINKRLWKVTFGRSIKRILAYTVNFGDGILVAIPARKDAAKRPPIERAIDFVLGTAVTLFGYLINSREQTKRSKEARIKVEKLNDEKLGDSEAEMIYIEVLATNPERQGGGYGTALVKTILSMADSQGRSVYLFSSNIANVSFYELFGFSVTAQVLLGDDNPKWRKPPVVMPMMIRKPRSGDGLQYID